MKKQYQAVTAAEAVKVIKSGDHVHISSVSNVPQCLVKALCDRGCAGELKNVYIHHLHTEGAAPYVNPEFEGIFQHNAFFVGANVRESVQKGLADYIPVFLGETSKLYREKYIKCNVAMIQRLGLGLGRCHHAQPHPLVHHQIRRSEPLRTLAARTCETHHLGGTPAVPRAVGRGRLQTLRAAFPLPVE